MGIIEGGVVIQDGVPRSVDPFARVRHVLNGETIQSAVDDAAAGDIIYIDAGDYDESITIATANLTLVGLGGRGSVAIAPSAVGAEGMLVTANDVTLINLGVAGESTADYALGFSGETARFRAYGCKFEGANAALVRLDETGDSLFRDCEFAWGQTGITIATGPVTELRLEGCLFHNVTTVHIAPGSGSYQDLWVTDCVFAGSDSGAAPTDFLTLSAAANNGIFDGNRFFVATNDTGVLEISANILWVANATEAGWSTARPE